MSDSPDNVFSFIYQYERFSGLVTKTASPSTIRTFGFLDFKTAHGNLENFTEVSLLAVPRDLYLDPDKEDLIDKLTLDLKSGGFNLDSYIAIDDFICRQQKPICLIAHKGYRNKRSDLHILKQELQKLDVSFSDDELCVEIVSFYDFVLENSRNDDMQAVNERTPERRPRAVQIVDVSRMLDFDQNISDRHSMSHISETDHFEISRKYGSMFLDWTHQAKHKFANINAEDVFHQ